MISGVYTSAVNATWFVLMIQKQSWTDIILIGCVFNIDGSKTSGW